MTELFVLTEFKTLVFTQPFLKKIKAADHNDWHTGRNLSCPPPHKTM